jgi:hypothetical protein
MFESTTKRWCHLSFKVTDLEGLGGLNLIDREPSYMSSTMNDLAPGDEHAAESFPCLTEDGWRLLGLLSLLRSMLDCERAFRY